jgi:hypothetical protein
MPWEVEGPGMVLGRSGRLPLIVRSRLGRPRPFALPTCLRFPPGGLAFAHSKPILPLTLVGIPVQGVCRGGKEGRKDEGGGEVGRQSGAEAVSSGVPPSQGPGKR